MVIPTHAPRHRWLGLIYHSLAGAYYVKAWLATLGPLIAIPPLLFLRPSIARGLLAVVGSGLTALGVSAWVASSRRRRASSNPDLRIGPLEQTLHVLANDEYTDSRQVAIEALRTGVAYYDAKFSWTGSGSAIPQLTQPAGGRINIRPQYLGSHQVVRVEFPRPLSRRETLAIDYSLSLTDPTRTVQPFLGAICPTSIRGSLTLRVLFAKPPPSSYKRQRFFSASADIPILEEVVGLRPGSNELYWLVPRPRPGYRYQIAW
jgi:hypothetical protein